MKSLSDMRMPKFGLSGTAADRQAIRILVVLLAVALVLFIGGSLLFSRVFSVHVTSVADYKRYELVAGTYQTNAVADGTVSAAKTNVEVPEADDGVVETVSVAEGDTVEKGQALVVIKSATLESAAAEALTAYEQAKSVQDQASSQYSAAESQVSDAQAAIDASKAEQQARIDAEIAALEQAKAEQEAQEAEETEEGAGTDATSDETEIDTSSVDTTITIDPSLEYALQAAQAEASSAQDVLEEAQDATASARTTYKTAKAKVDALSVSAGAAGTVVNLKAYVGMNMNMLKEQGSLMEIEDPTSLVVTCSMPQDDVASVARGQEAKVKGLATDGSELAATVSEVAEEPNGNTADNGSPCYDVTLTLESLENVTSDMGVTVDILLRDFGTVFYVPATAVDNEGDKSYVEIIYADESTAKHQVQVIAELDTGEKILQGNALAEGVVIREDLVST